MSDRTGCPLWTASPPLVSIQFRAMLLAENKRNRSGQQWIEMDANAFGYLWRRRFILWCLKGI